MVSLSFIIWGDYWMECGFISGGVSSGHWPQGSHVRAHKLWKLGLKCNLIKLLFADCVRVYHQLHIYTQWKHDPGRHLLGVSSNGDALPSPSLFSRRFSSLHFSEISF